MRGSDGVLHEPGCLAVLYPAVYGCFCEERMEERRRGESRLPPKHYMLDLEDFRQQHAGERAHSTAEAERAADAAWWCTQRERRI